MILHKKFCSEQFLNVSGQTKILYNKIYTQYIEGSNKDDDFISKLLGINV